MFKLDLIVSREVGGGTPNRMVDVEFRQQPFEIPEYFPIAVPAGTVPLLQSDNCAPTRLTRIESAHHPASGDHVAIRSKHVNPGRRVD
jgi:hypothetical protein